MAAGPEIIALMICGIVVFLGLVITSPKKKRLKLEEIIEIDRDKAKIDEAIKELEVEDSVLKKEDNLSWTQKKQRELQQSNAGITFPLYVSIQIIAMAVIFTVVYAIVGMVFIAAPLSFVGLLLPDRIVKSRIEKNSEKFNDDLVKALRRMASVMRAGGTLKQALIDVTKARSMPTIIRIEFKKVLSDIEYGMTIEQALYELFERTGSKDVQFLAVAVEIQRQLGGNIAQTFDTIGATISNRRVMESEIRATLAQVRTTSTILSVMPFVLGGIIYLISPGYFDPLFESLAGRFLFLVCIIFVAIGIFVIKKMSKIQL